MRACGALGLLAPGTPQRREREGGGRVGLAKLEVNAFGHNQNLFLAPGRVGFVLELGRRLAEIGDLQAEKVDGIA